jgi:hypothetical protein
MDRVGFLIEATGERLPCLLNPESIEITRKAGLRPRRSIGGALTGRGLTEDPLLYTGGGVTELKLDLLFDVELAGGTIETENVRHLTERLWALAENARSEEGNGRAALVRFVWGKAWNIPGVVAALSERLECFTPQGAPRRSWLRMRFVRVNPPDETEEGPTPGQSPEELLEALEGKEIPPDQLRVHELVGGSSGEEGEPPATGERLDDLAQRTYGDPSLWRLLAAFNGLDDPLHIPPGHLLRVPPISLSGNP